MTFSHALATNNYGTAKLIVATSAANGTHTTLATAMAAASAGDTIFLRDSVTENVTITPGVNITAWSGGSTNTPSITGTLTMTGAGTSTISGLELITNSAAIIAVTGSAASILNVNNCYLNCSNNSGITYSSSSSSSAINVYHCQGNLGTTGINLFAHSSAGTLEFFNSNITNTGASTTANTCSAGNLNYNYFVLANPTTTSGTATSKINHSYIDTSAQNVICYTVGGSGNTGASYSYFSSGTASAISISSTMNISLCNVNSSNTNAITGAGTINNSGVAFLGSSSKINTTTPGAFNIDVGGISFDGGTNTLSTYTQTTFTPTLAGSGTAGSPTMDFAVGSYTRLGNMVFVEIGLAWSAAGGATGNWLVTNLPFTIKNTAHQNPVFSTLWGYDTRAITTTSGFVPTCYGSVGTTNLNLVVYNPGTGGLTTLSTATTSGSLACNGFYFI